VTNSDQRRRAVSGSLVERRPGHDGPTIPLPGRVHRVHGERIPQLRDDRGWEVVQLCAGWCCINTSTGPPAPPVKYRRPPSRPDRVKCWTVPWPSGPRVGVGGSLRRPRLGFGLLLGQLGGGFAQLGPGNRTANPRPPARRCDTGADQRADLKAVQECGVDGPREPSGTTGPRQLADDLAALQPSSVPIVARTCSGSADTAALLPSRLE